MLISLLHHLSLLLGKTIVLRGHLGRDALFILWHTISHSWGHRPPLPSFRSLGLLDKSKLLCLVYKALHDVVFFFNFFFYIGI